MIFYDTETCGFHGPIVLIQYAFDEGPINLYSPWNRPVQETLELIEEFMLHDGGVCGFNLSFDHFHLCQLYTTLSLLKDKNKHPIDCIEEYYNAEPYARDGLCLKPVKAFDIMMHARKGPYQSTMDREDIRIKKVPTVLAWQLCAELNKRIPLKDIYFARREDKTIRWQVFDLKDDVGAMIPGFKDLVLKFSPSSALKALAIDTGVAKDDRLLYTDISLPAKASPAELGYAPFAKVFLNSSDSEIRGMWEYSWPFRIQQHVNYWSYNSLAREYAYDDVADTRGLYHFFGSPEPDDDDSVLTCMVGAVRWRGFRIDTEAIVELRQKAIAKEEGTRRKFNYNSHAVVRAYLEEVLSEAEKVVMSVDGKITTKGIILEEIAQWRVSEVCSACSGMGCNSCDDGLIPGKDPHPAAERAAEIIKARKAKKEIEVYDKLLLAGRFHADFVVIGTRSSRMAGTGGLNPQGIKKSNYVRKCFPLALENTVLCGGDFSGFEVCLADAAYADPDLRSDLMSGKKIHALFGVYLFPDKTYEEILKSDGAANFYEDFYGRSKNGVFALLYGGEAYTLSNRVGIPEKTAEEAYRRWCARYIVWGRERKKIFDMFCSMRQPGGIGTKVEWHEPSEYIESLFGFRRYFTLENQIVKALFDLANDPPRSWLKMAIKVIRRDREQTASGALRSALFAAAFAQQAANMRAAANHVIQSSGAEITKKVQRKIWDIQPCGINHWRVQPMNVHDEILSPTHPEYVPIVARTVKETVESFKEKVPLIKMDWKTHLDSWASKK
jgi:hypothetical protein